MIDQVMEVGELTVRQSRLIVFLWLFPGLLVIVCFFAAWFILLSEAGPQSRAWIQIGFNRLPISPEEGALGLQLFGALLLGLSLWSLAVQLRDAGGIGVSFKTDKVTVFRGGTHRALGLSNLSGARAYRFPVGTRLRLSSDTPPILLTDADALLAVARLRAIGISCRTNEAFDRIDIATLSLYEPIRWEGRLGWRSFSASRAYLLAMALLPIVIFAIWIVWIWSESSSDMGLKFFYSFFALMLVGFTALWMIVYGAAGARDWLFDVLGELAVTDRRIIWRAPLTGAVYREIERTALVDAYIVEQKADRAWIGLTLRDPRGDIKDCDLLGVPDPEKALSAIKGLIAL